MTDMYDDLIRRLRGAIAPFNCGCFIGNSPVIKEAADVIAALVKERDAEAEMIDANLIAAHDTGYANGNADGLRDGERRGLERAAKWLDQKREAYAKEHGTFDPATGFTEYCDNALDYMSELEEEAEEIRSLITSGEQSE